MKLYTCKSRGRAGRKNAMTLEEISSNEESNAGRSQLLMLLLNETPPL